MLRIGFKTQYYTLWNVSEPYKHYFGGQKYDFEWRIDYHYLRNLAKDEELAKEKAKGFGATNLEVDPELYGRNSYDFYTTGEKGTDRPDYIYPEGIHWQGSGRDIREMGMREVNLERSEGGNYHFKDTQDKINSQENDKDIKALWAMYLKKEILFGENAVRPDWIRPCVYARRQLINLGVIEKYDGLYMTPQYKDRYISKKKKEKLEKTLKDGHFHNQKERIEIELKKLTRIDLENQWGEWYCLDIYYSKDKKKYYYMGSSPAEISEDEWTLVKGTVDHNEYNGVPQTKLKRVMVPKPKLVS